MNEEIIRITDSLKNTSAAELKNRLIPLINDLLIHDFAGLMQILYRIDVDEKKLKSVLKENQHQDAASLIADEIIRRQLQKIATKKEFRQARNDGDGW